MYVYIHSVRSLTCHVLCADSILILHTCSYICPVGSSDIAVGMMWVTAQKSTKRVVLASVLLYAVECSRSSVRVVAVDQCVEVHAMSTDIRSRTFRSSVLSRLKDVRCPNVLPCTSRHVITSQQM
jgi:hypothetical protein